MLLIAGHVATPEAAVTHQPQITERASNAPIDLSLRATDKLSRQLFLESIAKTYVFVKIYTYSCPADNGCQDRIVQDFEEAFGPPRQNEVLSQMHVLGHLQLSVITLDVSCLNSRRSRPTGPRKLTAFFAINPLRTLLLCNTLQRWEPFHVLVDVQTQNRSINKQIKQMMSSMRRAIVDKNVTIQSHLHGNFEIMKMLPSLQQHIRSAEITTPKQLAKYVRTNAEDLQALLDADHPSYHLIPLAINFLNTNLPMIRHILFNALQQDQDPENANNTNKILLSYCYIVLGGLSEFLLSQPLTICAQTHYLFRRGNGSLLNWCLRTSAQRTSTPDLNGSVRKHLSTGEPISKDEVIRLYQYFPMFKVRAQLYLAFARLGLSLKIQFPKELVFGGEVSDIIDENLDQVTNELDKVQCVLANKIDDQKEGYQASDRDETLFWLMEMRYLTKQISIAEGVRSKPSPSLSEARQDKRTRQLPACPYHAITFDRRDDHIALSVRMCNTRSCTHGRQYVKDGSGS